MWRGVNAGRLSVEVFSHDSEREIMHFYYISTVIQKLL